MGAEKPVRNQGQADICGRWQGLVKCEGTVVATENARYRTSHRTALHLATPVSIGAWLVMLDWDDAETGGADEGRGLAGGDSRRWGPRWQGGPSEGVGHLLGFILFVLFIPFVVTRIRKRLG
jgi:hypothetical protein